MTAAIIIMRFTRERTSCPATRYAVVMLRYSKTVKPKSEISLQPPARYGARTHGCRTNGLCLFSFS